MKPAEILERLGLKEFMSYQHEALEWMMSEPLGAERMCLYYKTGAGKTITALASLAVKGYKSVLIVAPPATHDMWTVLADKLGFDSQIVSHAKFRDKDFKFGRYTPIIMDEMHLLGGHTAKGWVRFDRAARGLKAAVVMLSATPNYNDAERVYCVRHVLDPRGTGDYLGFLYQHCTTEQNPFSITPLVTGLRDYESAAEFLADLPGVIYVPDDEIINIQDIWLDSSVPDEFDVYGLDRTQPKIMASQIEARHRRDYLNRVSGGYIRDHVMAALEEISGQATTPIMVFSMSRVIAEALEATLLRQNARVLCITGTTSKKQKLEMLNQFREGGADVLVGTATLATGPDGLDKVCDTMVILHDTSDDAQRRQLAGRILHRGAGEAVTEKQFFRLSF